MWVIATAGHVDHGKSTLVRMLTGMEPDRYAEERRRGVTIDLGFAWTTLADGCTIAFVDVPGHERFVPTMLAGVGSTPAVMFVVAADEGWMPQSTEHLDALDALGVEHGLLVVTRCDLADPEPAITQARRHLHGTSLSGIPEVRVSGQTGEGGARLRESLDDLVHQLPPPDPNADTRLWIDRVFTIRGAGTVVTGTLRAGTLRTGDELYLPRGDTRVTVRGLHRMGAAENEVLPVSRVGVNLRGIPVDALRRGDALLTPGRWCDTVLLDARLRGRDAATVPRELMLHIGSASTSVRTRPLGHDTVRLSLRAPLPLRIGDRALLRDPGQHRIVAGVTVLDVRPPQLRRRGDARQRARELADREASPNGELARRRLVRADELRAMGAEAPPEAARAGSWLLDPSYREQLGSRLVELVEHHERAHPLSAGLSREAARRALDLPDAGLLPLVLGSTAATGLTEHHGRLRRDAPVLPRPVRQAVDALRAELLEHPFAAPTAQRLAELGLGEPELAAAVRCGELLRLGTRLVLLPGAAAQAANALAALPTPFTVSQAREQLGTTRRVAVPLMELLAREGYTERLTDGRHRLRG